MFSMYNSRIIYNLPKNNYDSKIKIFKGQKPLKNQGVFGQFKNAKFITNFCFHC